MYLLLHVDLLDGRAVAGVPDGLALHAVGGAAAAARGLAARPRRRLLRLLAEELLVPPAYTHTSHHSQLDGVGRQMSRQLLEWTDLRPETLASSPGSSSTSACLPWLMSISVLHEHRMLSPCACMFSNALSWNFWYCK